ncbi:MAG: NnrU family protein [Deltaproteobacteria bacterium]|nr:NnrU family protein [Deltaproteobacteria bacterium]
MTLLVLGLVIFLGVHSIAIVASPLRDSLARRLGELPWKGLYAAVAIVGFVLMVRGYAAARLAPHPLWAPPVATRHVAALLMLPVFPLLLAAYLPGRIQRATRHPMLAGTMLFALAHLLANGTLADLALFGGVGAWAVVDRISVARRPPRKIPSAPPRPLNDVIAVAGGLALYVAFVAGLHARLIGVSPFG